jgi:three-Cys-motif partner protein
MSAELGTTWEAAPHTIAKIEMVRKYLRVWLSILGTAFRGVDLWYIDGFAGPGEYSNHADGSPVAALQAADEALRESYGWKGGVVHCVFIEEDSARFANLEKVISSIPQRVRLKRHLFNDTFLGGLGQLRQLPTNPFQHRQPIFAFIDPFGIKGLPFEIVKELLSHERREVLINLDADGVARVYGAGAYANHRERLNEIFGDDAWERELATVPLGKLPHTIVAMYKSRLRAIQNIDYVFSFEMQSNTGKMDYHLVFATQHPIGLEKMKEVMKQFAHEGFYVFADDNQDRQSTLFRFDDPAHHAEQLAQQFKGRTVAYQDVEQYALNESPFTNPKKMLAALEKANRITVACDKATRRAAQYPNDAHPSMRITFLA